MITITFATQNAHKIKEMNALLNDLGVGDKIKLLLPESDEEIEETGQTFIDNARLKATQTPPAQGSDYVVADDSGIVVNALAGLNGLTPFPGVMSNRWLTPELATTILGVSPETEIAFSHKNQAVQTLLKDKFDRSGSYVCSMSVCDVKGNVVFETEGVSRLTIIEEGPRGEHGFGYDPITVSSELDFAKGEEKTFAELTMTEKNQISHRRKAFDSVVEFLLSHSSAQSTQGSVPSP